MSLDYSQFFLPHFFSETLTSIPSLLCILFFIAIFSFWLSPGGLAWARSINRGFPSRAIPGPSGLPLIGQLSAFSGASLTHRILSDLARVFNAAPLMAFSVGITRFIISSDPNTAKEILSSSVFADRPVKESAYELLFYRAMGFAPFGDYWRNLRRISSTYMFSPKRIASYSDFRHKIGLKMVEEIKCLMKASGGVEPRQVLHFASLNNVMMSVFGKCYEFGEGCVEGHELEGLVKEGYELLGIFNWSDHFPILQHFDLQGVRGRCKKLVSRVNVFVQRIVDEHKFKRRNDISSGDFCDILIGLQKDYNFSDSDVIAILWEMIFRGTDTVAILLEWILARMVLHQDIQSKVQAEIDAATDKSPVTDTHLPNLPYLAAVIKETLRMHPPGPLLSWARLAIHDTHVADHFIPSGTTAMVNMWAITHDPKIWPEPEKFDPERFVGEDVDVMGCDLRLAPFGSGRRVCPGKAMGMVTAQLWLAQLLQNFRWVEDAEGVDLSERLKLSLEMKKSLSCKAVPRVF